MRAQLHVHIVKFIFVSTMSVSVFKSRGSSFEQILEKKILKSNFIIITKNRGFRRAAERHFQCLAGPINVSVDLKYDVLCLSVFVYGIST